MKLKSIGNASHQGARLAALSAVVAVLAAGAAISAGAATTRGGAGLTKASLRLDWSWQIYHEPFLWAQEKGYYKAAGIDLNIEQGQGSGTTIVLVGQGRDTFGFADTGTMVQSAAKGLPAENVLVVQRRSTFGVECYKDANVSKPADLVGKSVLIIPQESTATFWPAFLAVNHIDASKVHVVNADFSNKVKLFLNHQADCMAGVLGEDMLDASSRDSNIGAPLAWASYGVKGFGHGIVVSKKTIAKSPSLVAGFVKASIRGWKAVCGNQRAALTDYFSHHSDLTAADKAHARQELPIECSKLVPGPGDPGKALGPTSRPLWAAMIAVLKRYAGVKTSKAPTAFYTNRFLK
jgi:NitT/TauT family transport system substrate-binding protein